MPDEDSFSDAATTEYKKRIQDAIERMEIEYDKALLTLNPAAITVTIALYNQLVAAGKAPSDTSFLIYRDEDVVWNVLGFSIHP